MLVIYRDRYVEEIIEKEYAKAASNRYLEGDEKTWCAGRDSYKDRRTERNHGLDILIEIDRYRCMIDSDGYIESYQKVRYNI